MGEEADRARHETEAQRQARKLAESPLGTFTVDELWDELRSRFEACVFISLRRAKIGDDTEISDRRWCGGKSQALGLITMMQGNLLKTFNDDAVEDAE